MNRSVLLAAYIYISNADEAVRRKKKRKIEDTAKTRNG